MTENLPPGHKGQPPTGQSLDPNELDNRYRAALVRFCTGYLTSQEEAEDAVQEVFAKACAAQAVPHNMRAWLYTVARNQCLNLLRSRGRRLVTTPMPSDIELAASCTGQVTGLLRREEYQHLQRLLQSLSSAERELIRLRYGEDLSRGEIAEVLELPESTVKSRLFETLKKLRGRADPESY